MDYGEKFPIEDYYRKVVIPINPRKFRISSGGKMICCLHDDTDPSLGVMKSKNGERYHCFGCGSWGDVVDLHIKVSKKYKKKSLNREEALKELCALFKIDYSEVEENEKQIDTSEDIKREDLIKGGKSKFDISDMKYRFLDGKLKGKKIGYFNALMLTMLWEVKENSND